MSRISEIRSLTRSLNRGSFVWGAGVTGFDARALFKGKHGVLGTGFSRRGWNRLHMSWNSSLTSNSG